MEEQRKSSNIIERHSTSEGKIVVQSALLELEARIKSLHTVLDEIKEALAGYAHYMEKMDDRIVKLEPNIQIFSANEAKSYLSDISKNK